MIDNPIVTNWTMGIDTTQPDGEYQVWTIHNPSKTQSSTWHVGNEMIWLGPGEIREFRLKMPRFKSV
jgi:hypothetical protein